jgi:hypothetical protein
MEGRAEAKGQSVARNALDTERDQRAHGQATDTAASERKARGQMDQLQPGHSGTALNEAYKV